MQPLLETIGHIFGVCPDSTGHITIVDILNVSFPEFEHTVNYFKHFIGQGFNKSKN